MWSLFKFIALQKMPSARNFMGPISSKSFQTSNFFFFNSIWFHSGVMCTSFKIWVHCSYACRPVILSLAWHLITEKQMRIYSFDLDAQLIIQSHELKGAWYVNIRTISKWKNMTQNNMYVLIFIHLLRFNPYIWNFFDENLMISNHFILSQTQNSCSQGVCISPYQLAAKRSIRYSCRK